MTERRARLGRRHGLAKPLDGPVAVADAMVVLHATDPATVFLSTLARLNEPSIAAVERALYDDRSLVRTLAMRRTLFVASRDALAAVEQSSTPAVAATERKRLEAALSAGGVADPASWLVDAATEVAAALGFDGAPARDDLAPVAVAVPWAALLPALDPTPMGWKQRDWYLGDHAGPLFDRNGNIGPTVWADGRIVGGWGQRPDGEIVVELLEDVGADHQALVDNEVDRLSTAIGDIVVKPSFPTPLQKRIARS